MTKIKFRILNNDVPEMDLKNLPAKKEEPLGQSENIVAEIFVEKHKNDIRYCEDEGSWYKWDETRWVKTHKNRIINMARVTCKEYNTQGKAGLGSLKAATSVVGLAQCFPEVIITSEQLDSDVNLLGTPAGVVDLKTGELLPPDRDYLITKSVPHTPTPTADCPLWFKFLDEATRGDKDLQRYMQQIAGYCLTGDTSEQCLFFIYGDGGNGKSIFLNALNDIVGEYASTAVMNLLMTSKSERHSTELAMLKGARLVSVSETDEGKTLAEGLIKQLTGGDKITARYMRQDNFIFTPQFKIIIVGNHAPALQNVDAAMKRRFNVIPFVHKPEKPDHELGNKLKDEAAGIFRWAIEGCLDWKANGLIKPACVVAETNEYFVTQDSFSEWFESDCFDQRNNFIVGKKQVWTPTVEVYEAWRQYAEDNGYPIGSTSSLIPKIRRLGFEKVKKGNKWVFIGLSLKKNRPADEIQAEKEAEAAADYANLEACEREKMEAAEAEKTARNPYGDSPSPFDDDMPF